MRGKKNKICPLCNGRPFEKGDDPKTLCVNHLINAMGLLLVAAIKDMQPRTKS